MTTRRLADLAQELGGHVVGNDSQTIHGVAGIREARPGDLTFLANPRYETYLSQTRASAVLVSEPRPNLDLAQIVHANPYLAFLKAVKLFRQERPRPAPGIHPSAVI